jgi:hypothetical protein
MHARHYSPLIGRFLQPDPTATESNLYAYAENSPVTMVDPDGRWLFVAFAAIGIFAAAAPLFASAPRVAPHLDRVFRAFPVIYRGAPALQRTAASAQSAASGLQLRLQYAVDSILRGGGVPIAGRGSGSQIHDIARLIRQYGGSQHQWIKMVPRRTYNDPGGYKWQLNWYQLNMRGRTLIVERKWVPTSVTK